MQNTQRKTACKMLTGELHEKSYLGNQGRGRHTEVIQMLGKQVVIIQTKLILIIATRTGSAPTLKIMETNRLSLPH
jgi:hypothetical protein